MYDTILVPTDGSDHAVRAAEHALYLADAFDATVHVITVVDLESAAGPFAAGGVDDDFLERIRADGRETIADLEAAIGPTDRLRTAVVEGRPSEAILEYAGEHDADLLAMGTHGRTGVRRYAWGSVTERVVRGADRPVLTVRDTDRSRIDDGYDDVLIPTDGSESATAAVEHGLAIAETADATVHALHVVDAGDGVGSGSVRTPTEYLTDLESAGEKATEEIATRARDAGLDAVSAVQQGHPASGILDYVDDADVDLVAMGTQGRTGLNRYLLGSTAERVLRHAPVPVVAVNTRDRGED
ncbi:universal stress protein [Halorientalis halophila]|uniref:universal stress protein n=1 Tax=Halorientalis halophila TaxID=3108499 RepID=UPI00300A0CC8